MQYSTLFQIFMAILVYLVFLHLILCITVAKSKEVLNSNKISVKHSEKNIEVIELLFSMLIQLVFLLSLLDFILDMPRIAWIIIIYILFLVLFFIMIKSKVVLKKMSFFLKFKVDKRLIESVGFFVLMLIQLILLLAFIFTLETYEPLESITDIVYYSIGLAILLIAAEYIIIGLKIFKRCFEVLKENILKLNELDSIETRTAKREKKRTLCESVVIFLIFATVHLAFFPFLYDNISRFIKLFYDSNFFVAEMYDYFYYTLSVSFSLPDYPTIEKIKAISHEASLRGKVINVITSIQIIIQYFIDVVGLGTVASFLANHLFKSNDK